jgi:hypothetical protein
MMRIVAAFAFLLISAAAVNAEENLFKSPTAESVLTVCKGEGDRQQGFCLGFIEALAVRLADTRESCTHWPVNMAPLIEEAVDALAIADKDDAAWKVIEGRLSEKHLPPCK